MLVGRASANHVWSGMELMTTLGTPNFVWRLSRADRRADRELRGVSVSVLFAE